MPLSPELVARMGDLKRDLVAFGQSRRFARQLDEAIWRYVDGAGDDDEGTIINAIDHFLLQERLPDGRTVVEVFVEQYPMLPEEERALLLGWRDVVEGLFEAERRDDESLIATNLIDDLTYRLRSNVGPAIFERTPPGSFIMSRAVPLGDEWMLSGSSSLYPAEYRDEVYRAAAQASLKAPRQVFRNPEKLALGWELQRKERDIFVSFFGSDLVVLSGHEIAARMRAYMHYQIHEVRDSDGKTAADRAREQYGTEPAEIDYGLPLELTKADTIGVVYDEVEGMAFWPEFGLLEEAFANPDRVARGRHRRIVVNYLDEPSLSPLALRRVAERDPDRASRVFAQVLKRPAFSWDRDGDALLRDRKASHYERPPLPSVIPLSDRLSRASVGQAAPKPKRRGRATPRGSSRSRRRPRCPPGGETLR